MNAGRQTTRGLSEGCAIHVVGRGKRGDGTFLRAFYDEKRATTFVEYREGWGGSVTFAPLAAVKAR